VIGESGVFTNPDMLVLAAQTVGVVAYIRQHAERVNGPWVFPVCVASACVVCFAASADVVLDMRFVQHVIAVSVLAFGIMVLRRGGNGATSTPNSSPDDRGGPTPPFLHPTDHSPLASFVMHAIPVLILASIALPMVVRLIR
jgi:hypothetical protein